MPARNQKFAGRPLGFRKLHAYSASFGDDLAHALIARHTAPGEIVLDPFAGAATTLLQARLWGRAALGIDVDPVAGLIGRVVTAPYSLEELDWLNRHVTGDLAHVALELSARKFDEFDCRPGASISANGFSGTVPQAREVAFWFAPLQRVLLALLVALADSLDEARHRDIVRLAVSSAIIRKWPNTISQARDLDHSRPHRVRRDDLSSASQVEVFRKVFSHTISSLKKLNHISQGHPVTGRVIQGDAAEVLTGLEPNSADYVLTSPPYFNAIDYPRSHKFALWWLWPEQGHLTRDNYLGLKPGGRGDDVVQRCLELVPAPMQEMAWLRQASRATYLALCRYVVDLAAVLKALVRVLRPGRWGTLVVANNIIRGQTVPTVEIVADLLRNSGFKDVQVEQRQIKASRRRYPYGIKGFRGPMTWEYLVEARKPAHTPETIAD